MAVEETVLQPNTGGEPPRHSRCTWSTDCHWHGRLNPY